MKHYQKPVLLTKSFEQLIIRTQSTGEALIPVDCDGDLTCNTLKSTYYCLSNILTVGYIPENRICNPEIKCDIFITTVTGKQKINCSYSQYTCSEGGCLEDAHCIENINCDAIISVETGNCGEGYESEVCEQAS